MQGGGGNSSETMDADADNADNEEELETEAKEGEVRAGPTLAKAGTGHDDSAVGMPVLQTCIEWAY